MWGEGFIAEEEVAVLVSTKHIANNVTAIVGILPKRLRADPKRVGILSIMNCCRYR